MKNPDYPTIGIVSISYNDEKIIGDCLTSIRDQSYPQDNIEIYYCDGGSTDRTVEIIESYGATVISRPDLIDKAYIRGELIAATPKTDIILFLSADCRLEETDCLLMMVKSLQDAEIVGVQTLRYAVRPQDPILSRYLSLIGGVDPIAVGLKKADRSPYDIQGWHSKGKVTDKDFYLEVQFSDDISTLPAIGANGFAIKREYFDLVGGYKNGAHADACARLIRLGHNKFAFLKDRHIVHYVDLSLTAFLKRRIVWALQYSGDKIPRDYSVMTRNDIGKLLWVIISYSTLVVPFFHALKGYLHKRDAAWFLHPFVCFAFFVSYSLLYGLKTISKLKKALGI